MTYLSRSRMEAMTEPECYSMLRRHQYGVGRIGLGGDRPVILPVNYLLDRGDVVVQTGDGTIKRAAEAGDRVAFEIDSITSPAQGQEVTGWSVLLKGQAHVVDEAAEQAFLRMGHLAPSAGGFKPNFVRIVVDEMTGRRF
jgi:nitroimidazol reductase NimA-like FMN-containing flavoprotein (pyridoxamine 5'-phosphate oxidase superfamily)